MTITQSLSPEAALTRTLNFKDVHHRLWWEAISPPIQQLMTVSDYTEAQRVLALTFVHQKVIPFMGAYPTREDGFPWKTYCTADFTPMELSLNFQPGKKTFRMNIVPSSAESGRPRDPLNQKVALRLTRHLQTVLDGVDLTWFEHFVQHLFVADADIAHARKRQPIPDYDRLAVPNVTAFDFEGTDIRLKPYFAAPWQMALTGRSSTDVIFDAFAAMDPDVIGPYRAGLALLEDYCRSARAAAHSIVPSFLSFDCSQPKQSRLKVYLHCPNAALASVQEMFTLGGANPSPDAVAGVEELHQLWNALFHLAPDFPDDRAPREITHAAAGVLVNFEIKPGAQWVEPKVYIPVGYYSGDDLAIADGLESFFARHHWTHEAATYKANFRSIFAKEGQDPTAAHHDISFSYVRGQCYITAYYKPHIPFVPAAMLESSGEDREL